MILKEDGEEEEEYEEEDLDYVSRRRPRPRELVGYSGKRERRVHRHRPDRFVFRTAHMAPLINLQSPFISSSSVQTLMLKCVKDRASGCCQRCGFGPKSSDRVRIQKHMF